MALGHEIEDLGDDDDLKTEHQISAVKVSKIEGLNDEEK